jgi:hypothetical protein
MEIPQPNDLAAPVVALSTSESGRKHITPIDLENIVKSVTESKLLEPLSPLPRSLCLPSDHLQSKPVSNLQELSRTEPERKESASPPKLNPESSTSTMATTGSQGSQLSNLLEDSSSTEVSGTSVIRGFSKENISRSRISRTQLAPQPITKPTPIPTSSIPTTVNAPVLRKKPVAFMLGGSEGDESSPESLASRSFLADGLRTSRKITSFKDEVQMIQDRMGGQAEEAIDDSDDEPSESAIDDEDEWEDEPDPSAQVDNGELFKRVDSSSNLVSRRSLITTMMHEKDRAAALQNAASRSTPAIRRRTSSHNGPLGSSPSNDHIPLSRARPINVTLPNPTEGGQLPPSPRTNRRNMLSTELTGSLRKHLLWERQNRNPASKALKNRNYRSEIKLSDHVQAPYMGPSDPSLRRKGLVDFYDNGLQEYFEKGW